MNKCFLVNTGVLSPVTGSNNEEHHIVLLVFKGLSVILLHGLIIDDQQVVNVKDLSSITKSALESQYLCLVFECWNGVYYRPWININM